MTAAVWVGVSGAKVIMALMRLSHSGGKAVFIFLALVVAIIIVLAKLAVLPAVSVKRASSKTWRNRLIIFGWAFSISSSRSRVYGWWRTASVKISSNRSTLAMVWYSLMSSRIMFLVLPKNSEAKALAVSVFPTPVGPANKNPAMGLLGLSSWVRARLIA